MEDKNSGILLGIIIGAIVAIALLKKQETMQITSSELDWKPIDIPRVDDVKPIIQPIYDQTYEQIKVYDSKINKIESQLERTTSHLEQTTNKLLELNDTISKIQNQNSQQTIQPVYIQPNPIQQLQPPICQLHQSPQVIVRPIIESEESSGSEESSTGSEYQHTIQQSTDKQVTDKNISKDSIPINTNKNQNHQNLQDTIYKNNEKWNIIRGSDGRIKSLNIVRDIKKLEK